MTMLRAVPRLYCANIELLYKQIGSTNTTDLLSRLGYVAYPKAGLVHWLSPGLSVLKNLEKVVCNRINQADFEEVSLLLISHNQLWKKLGRWGNLGEMFKLEGGEFLLVPTAEEEITEYVRQNVTSYKQLPLRYYQVNAKFRNEKRPRGGLLRGKEFVMKDAYSFDATEAEAMAAYNRVIKLYHDIFTDLKVPYVVANADSGDIGGNLSHEWHIAHESGEDTVFTCDDCGHTSNIEKTVSYPEEPEDTANVAVQYYATIDKGTVVCVYYPANRKLDTNLVKAEIPDVNTTWTNTEEIVSHFSSDGPEAINRKVVRIMDLRLTLNSNFPDFPFPFVSRANITTLTDISTVSAVEGEICGQCEEGTIHSTKAIEIGHTFYLGTKYSEPMECTVEVPDANGATHRQPLYMGCYGIGLSRIIATIAEINRDEQGLRWPVVLAPWQLTVVEAGKQDYTQLYERLDAAGIDYRVDKRSFGVGRKIKDLNLMGIPLVAIVGKNWPQVDVEVRGKFVTQTWKSKQDATMDWVETDGKHQIGVESAGSAIAALLEDM